MTDDSRNSLWNKITTTGYQFGGAAFTIYGAIKHDLDYVTFGLILTMYGTSKSEWQREVSALEERISELEDYLNEDEE